MLSSALIPGLAGKVKRACAFAKGRARSRVHAESMRSMLLSPKSTVYRSNKRIFAAHARTQQTTVENLQDLAPRVVPEEHAPWTWTTPEGGDVLQDVAPFYPPLWTLFPIRFMFPN